ncbi:MAG: hypothetical protein ACTS3F_02990 [Phycisphaerales bacterium]
MQRTNFMITMALVAAGAAGTGTLTSSARAGCVCPGEVIDCIQGGGSQFDCGLMWLVNPCFPSPSCWDPIAPNIVFAGNGIGGVPAVPFSPDASVIFIPLLVVDFDGNQIPQTQIASIEAQAFVDEPPGSSANPFPPVLFNAAGQPLVEFFTSGYDSGEPVSLIVKASLVDGATGQGLVMLVPECPGDLNFDGKVNSDDLAILLGAFGAGAGGDCDTDGETDSDDLAILLSAFGTTCR